jgi:hypothetical protein
VKTNVEIDGSTASERIETFFESLAQNRTLDSLRLSIHGFNEKAITALTNYLQNNPSLRDLKLEPFLWGSGNQKMLAEALGHNDHLEELDYDDFIKKSSLAKINQLLEKNIEAHTLRREEFIYNLISLNHSSDLWKSLPLDIKLHIVNFLDFSGETDIGKSKEQIYGCTHFLFTHFSDCYAIIKTGKRVLILEETDLRARYHFRFFKPNEVEVETIRSGELRLITL